jgi:hypothetical protein
MSRQHRSFQGACATVEDGLKPCSSSNRAWGHRPRVLATIRRGRSVSSGGRRGGSPYRPVVWLAGFTTTRATCVIIWWAQSLSSRGRRRGRQVGSWGSRGLMEVGVCQTANPGGSENDGSRCPRKRGKWEVGNGKRALSPPPNFSILTLFTNHTATLNRTPARHVSSRFLKSPPRVTGLPPPPPPTRHSQHESRHRSRTVPRHGSNGRIGCQSRRFVHGFGNQSSFLGMLRLISF